MAVRLSSQEVNYLVWKYLQKEGLALSSAALEEEVHASNLKGERFSQSDLVTLLLKGLQLQDLESVNPLNKAEFEPKADVLTREGNDGYGVTPATTISGSATAVAHLSSETVAIGFSTGKTIILEGIESTPKLSLEAGATDGQVTVISSGPTLAVGHYSGSIKIWDSLGQLMRVLDLHRAPIICLSWSPDGQLLASADCNNFIAIWNPATGELKRRMSIAPELLTSLEWIDTRTYAVVQASSLAVFKVDNDVPIVQFLGHSKPISCLSFDKPSQLLASGGEDAVIQIWHARSQTPLRTLNIHSGPITLMKWVPGPVEESLDAAKISSRLLSAGVDGKIAFWDLNNPSQPLWVIERLNAVMLLEFSPNYDYFAAGTASELVFFSTVDMDTPHRLGSCSIRGLQDLSWVGTLAAVSVEGAALFNKIT